MKHWLDLLARRATDDWWQGASGEREFTVAKLAKSFGAGPKVLATSATVGWCWAESLGDFRYGGYELICRAPVIHDFKRRCKAFVESVSQNPQVRIAGTQESRLLIQ
jgi:hypothetical protein